MPEEIENLLKQDDEEFLYDSEIFENENNQPDFERLEY